MNDGFLRVAAVSPHVCPGNVKLNTAEIIANIKYLASREVKLAVFPELSITGYNCGDMFLHSKLFDSAAAALKQILKETASLPILFYVGLPVISSGKLYNAAAACYMGTVKSVTLKKHIPNYNEYYEKRYFNPGAEAVTETGTSALIKLTSEKSGVNVISDAVCGAEICEDLWLPNPPSNELCEAGATVICNLSASNAVIGKDIYRRDLVKMQSARTISAYIYANAGRGESTSDCVYDGQSFIAENGVILAESEPFMGGSIIADIDVSKLNSERMRMSTFKVTETNFPTVKLNMEKKNYANLLRNFPRYPFVPADNNELAKRLEYIIKMQAHALCKRMSSIGTKTAVIGLSGGLDSTLAFLVTVKAFDILNISNKGIIAVTMPCFGTTSRTKSNAEKLAAAFDTDFREIDITEAVKLHFRDIGLPEDDRTTAFENVQARERTQILMDIANMHGGIVIGTGDLSELALGWSTYNGDHMSMYGVNSGVPKTLVRHLVRYFIKDSSKEIAAVLEDILATPVSPELLPASEGEQHTEEIIGPYELHDFFLYYFVRQSYSPEKILRIAKQAWKGVYSPEVIKKWLDLFISRFFSMQFKRSCLPDGVKVGSVSLSPRADFRMPSDISKNFLF
ncbi:MAG: NAD(+) synthase [Ruminococcus sp.]|jgi:NAD+ synthase (glutamine-hydrolysing)|nr:NAD(+) synthase [Ruminococcus sp.]